MAIREHSAEELEYRAALSSRLREVRMARDLSVSELARRSGLAPSLLRQYEDGTVMMTPFGLDRLAKALDCDPGWLLSGRRKNGKTGQER